MREKNTGEYIHHEIHNQDTFRARLFNSLREVVFGLQDGIVSTLGAITGIAGGTQDSRIVIISGLVVIVVESLSMAAGTFLSSKSEKEAEQRLLREEAKEIEKYPEAETQELREFYEERGFSAEEIDILVKRITSDKDLWLEEMAFKELGVIPHDDQGNPVRDAIYMGVSYIFGGGLSLIGYFFLPIEYALPVSILASVIALFIIGYVKGVIVETNKVRSGIEMMTVSLVAAGFGYAVGRIASMIFGVGV